MVALILNYGQALGIGSSYQQLKQTVALLLHFFLN